jgi:hypothetical protein
MAGEPAFLESIARGKLMADAEVANRLHQPACGYSHGAVKLYRQDDGSVTQVPYTVEYPPDTQAASLWLRNRRRQDWRERHEVEAKVADESILDRYTEEQLIARLVQRRQQRREMNSGLSALSPAAKLP